MFWSPNLYSSILLNIPSVSIVIDYMSESSTIKTFSLSYYSFLIHHSPPFSFFFTSTSFLLFSLYFFSFLQFSSTFPILFFLLCLSSSPFSFVFVFLKFFNSLSSFYFFLSLFFFLIFFNLSIYSFIFYKLPHF